MWGGGWWQGATHTHAHACACMHAYACACTRTCVWHHREFPGISPMGRPFAWNYHVYHECVCMRAHACMHVHVHVCVGHPRNTFHPHTPTHPHPQSRREPKTPKFNKSWTNRDNSILFEDSLPLNIPELISTIGDHPRHPPPTCPTPPEPRKPKSEALQ